MEVRPFYLDVFPVTNAHYWAYRAKKRFVRSQAEVAGWSWVTQHVVSDQVRESRAAEGSEGWLAVTGARWDR